MEEKILNKKNNGMPVLLGIIALYILAVFGVISGNYVLFIPSIIWIYNLKFYINRF